MAALKLGILADSPHIPAQHIAAMNLPQPDPIALQHSESLRAHIIQAIDAAGGWLPFVRYMELALYAPGLGYYSSGARKFGAGGDFITAPELSPLFAQTLAAQVVELMQLSAPQILEAGAGSGALVTDLLLELEQRDALPRQYAILELSGELRRRQQETLAQRAPRLASRVVWLDTVPAHFDGVVLANEVLDAMPVHLLAWREAGIFERGVALDANGELSWEERPAQGALLAAAQALAVAAPYQSEINLAARAWIRQWGNILGQGALLLIDYGFPQREYYHPQRNEGTLMCHYRHHAHGDPFFLPGLNDLTAHVDFSALARAGEEAGLERLGYTSQAQFLINCGMMDILARHSPADAANYLPLANKVQKLLSPAEMGELFKVLALARGIGSALMGFVQGERNVMP